MSWRIQAFEDADIRTSYMFACHDMTYKDHENDEDAYASISYLRVVAGVLLSRYV